MAIEYACEMMSGDVSEKIDVSDRVYALKHAKAPATKSNDAESHGLGRNQVRQTPFPTLVAHS